MASKRFLIQHFVFPMINVAMIAYLKIHVA